MLDDRPYMRPEDPRFRAPSMQQPWSGWAILLTINVVVFLLQVIVDPNSLSERMDWFEKSIVGRWFALDSSRISWLLPLQLFTYQFLHGSVIHLLMNGIGLFFIGRALEPAIGRREIVALYLVSGVLGALFQLGFAAVFPNQFAGPMVGASAGVFGFMGVLARLFPHREVYLLLFFILPIRLKLHWVFWGKFCNRDFFHFDGDSNRSGGFGCSCSALGWAVVRCVLRGQVGSERRVDAVFTWNAPDPVRLG